MMAQNFSINNIFGQIKAEEAKTNDYKSLSHFFAKICSSNNFLTNFLQKYFWKNICFLEKRFKIWI